MQEHFQRCLVRAFVLSRKPRYRQAKPITAAQVRDLHPSVKPHSRAGWIRSREAKAGATINTTITTEVVKAT